MEFPKFMCNEENMIPASQQNTLDIEGYYYTANDGSQMAFWTYKADSVSKEHTHDYDEWMLNTCFWRSESEGVIHNSHN